MRGHQHKQQEQQKYRDLFNASSTEFHHCTVEERVERCKSLQYEKHQQLFAVSYSTIHKAAAENSLLGVKYFLTLNKKDKNKKSSKLTILEEMNRTGMAPIHFAAERGSVDVLEFLLENGCNVDLLSMEGNTALMYACKNNQLNSVILLLDPKWNANLLIRNKCGMNCIHFAAQCDNSESIETIIGLIRIKESMALSYEKEKDKVEVFGDESTPVNTIADLTIALDQPSNIMTTPLHVACYYGSMKTIELLVQNRVNIDALDCSGETAIHKAARKSYFHIYRYLMVNGASDTIQNNFRESPADCLVDNPKY
jgi:ankyrin repeat protein